MDIKRNRSLLASSKPHLHRCRRINEMKSRRGRKLLLLLFVLIDIVLTKDTNNAGEHAKLGPTITSKACFRAMPPKMSHLKMCLVLTLRSAPIVALRLLSNAQILSYPSLIGYMDVKMIVDVRKPMVASIAQRSKKLSLYNLVSNLTISYSRVKSGIFKCIYWLNGSAFLVVMIGIFERGGQDLSNGINNIA